MLGSVETNSLPPFYHSFRTSLVPTLSILTFFLLFPVLTELSYIASALPLPLPLLLLPGELQYSKCERTNGPVAAPYSTASYRKKRELTGYETWEGAFVHRGEEREKRRQGEREIFYRYSIQSLQTDSPNQSINQSITTTTTPIRFYPATTPFSFRENNVQRRDEGESVLFHSNSSIERIVFS